MITIIKRVKEIKTIYFCNFYYFLLKKLAAVDTFDKKFRKFSVRRRTNRWTLNTGMYIVDSSASNAVVLYELKFREKFEKNARRARRLALENLAIELLKPCIKWRKEERQKNNFIGVKKNVQNAIVRTGEILYSLSTSPVANDKRLDKQKWCGVCSGPNRLKSNTTCINCGIVICTKLHCFSYCKTCNLKLDK